MEKRYDNMASSPSRRRNLWLLEGHTHRSPNIGCDVFPGSSTHLGSVAPLATTHLREPTSLRSASLDPLSLRLTSMIELSMTHFRAVGYDPPLWTPSLRPTSMDPLSVTHLHGPTLYGPPSWTPLCTAYVLLPTLCGVGSVASLLRYFMAYLWSTLYSPPSAAHTFKAQRL